MNWRTSPLVGALMSHLRQLPGAYECAWTGSRKTAAEKRRQRDLKSVISALPEIHRAPRRQQARRSARLEGGATGSIQRRAANAWRTSLISKPSVIAAAFIFLLVSGSLLITRDHLAYAVVYDGKEIGVVASRQIGDALRLQVQQGLERQWGTAASLPATISFIVCRTPGAILTPPGELAESIRGLPWIIDGGPAFKNKRPVLLAEEKLDTYGSASRGSDNDAQVLQRELRDQKEEADIAAKNGPVRSIGGIPSIAHPVTLEPAKISSLFSFAASYIGTRFVWGGTSPNPGFDCSGFTQHVFHHLGINLRRTSQEQYLEGTPVTENNLQPGDLVFFSTYTCGASHVGIYVGGGRMVDSEVSGVIYDNITNSYWAPRYLGARRIVRK